MTKGLTGRPHLSVSRERGGGAGAGGLGRLGPSAGRERKEEESWAGFGPKTKKGKILNFFE